jgi:hypothetical protein
MAIYDFSELESKFPEIIGLLSNPFDSHEFILSLAQHNQVEYVKALYAYKDTVNREKPAPFQAVHKAIIQKLKSRTDFVELIRDNKPSKDIFGNPQTCGEWKKVL